MPGGFLYLGRDERGQPEAMAVGTDEELVAAAAILARLGGTPVEQCWPEPEPERTLAEIEDLPPWFRPQAHYTLVSEVIAYLRTLGGH